MVQVLTRQNVDIIAMLTWLEGFIFSASSLRHTYIQLNSNIYQVHTVQHFILRHASFLQVLASSLPQVPAFESRTLRHKYILNEESVGCVDLLQHNALRLKLVSSSLSVPLPYLVEFRDVPGISAHFGNTSRLHDVSRSRERGELIETIRRRQTSGYTCSVTRPSTPCWLWVPRNAEPLRSGSDIKHTTYRVPANGLKSLQLNPRRPTRSKFKSQCNASLQNPPARFLVVCCPERRHIEMYRIPAKGLNSEKPPEAKASIFQCDVSLNFKYRFSRRMLVALQQPEVDTFLKSDLNPTRSTARCCVAEPRTAAAALIPFRDASISLGYPAHSPNTDAVFPGSSFQNARFGFEFDSAKVQVARRSRRDSCPSRNARNWPDVAARTRTHVARRSPHASRVHPPLFSPSSVRPYPPSAVGRARTHIAFGISARSTRCWCTVDSVVAKRVSEDSTRGRERRPRWASGSSGDAYAPSRCARRTRRVGVDRRFHRDSAGGVVNPSDVESPPIWLDATGCSTCSWNSTRRAAPVSTPRWCARRDRNDTGHRATNAAFLHGQATTALR
ncbi:hypothetical protein C8R43DRAFT_1127251 [Mycena crocata]|nr:hypothetical protein C8R43DRAFT_1127251 [Mycena crocata]